MQSQLLSTPDPGELATHYDRAGEPFSVRALRAQDRPGLEDFYETFHPQRAAQGLPPSGRPRIARWLQGVLHHGVHLLAWRGEALIGHALVVPAGEPGLAEYAVFLHQGERGKGVGGELTRAAIGHARDGGIARLWLSVDPMNRAAVRTYESVGFRFHPATIFSSEAEMTLDLLT